MISLRLPAALVDLVRSDLHRPHVFALERVGFLKARQGALPGGGLVLLGYEYLVVPDDAYVEDVNVGARITDVGFRPARQAALSERASVIHVHLHSHLGRPGPSRTDADEAAHFMPDFVRVARAVPHVALILSRDSASGHVWHDDAAEPLSNVTIVGAPLLKVCHA